MEESKKTNSKKKKKTKVNSKRIKNRVVLGFVRVLFILVLVIGFAGLGAGLGLYFAIIDSSPDINLLNVTPDAYTSIVYDDKGVEMDRLHGTENREYVKMSEIPKYIQDAVVAIEDARFYTHNGIDPKGMARAMVNNVSSIMNVLKTGTVNGLEGASTITQQLIKNNLFTEAFSERGVIASFKRKFQEQYLAVVLEGNLTEELGSKEKAKSQILELYLNTINLGSGTYGVQAASLKYFGKDASELTLSECSMLAGITQNPSKYDPIVRPENTKKRQKMVLDNMLELNFITQAEYDEAINDDVYSRIQDVQTEVQETTSSVHSYYTDQVIEEVIKDLQEQKGLSRAQASNLVYSSGLQIYSCNDLEMQKIVDETYADNSLFPQDDYWIEATYTISVANKETKKQSHYSKSSYVKTEEEAQAFADKIKEEILADTSVELVLDKLEKTIQPQSAFVISDYHTGQVKAIAGGRGEKTANRTYNRATQAKRQPGSTFKVLSTYLPGIDTGVLTPATVFNDAPYTVDGWTPGNWYSNGYRGLSTVRVGISYSMNIVAAKAIAAVGLDTSWDYLQNLGFTTLIEKETRNGKVYTDKNPTICLGGLTDGVTMVELNAAYGAIANDGEYVKPIFYTKVLDHDGNVILENVTESKRVMKETTSFLLTDMMEDVITGPMGTAGTAAFRSISMPIAGKTGTTSNNYDLLFSAYTPYYAATIWLGHDNPKEMSNSSYHLQVWRTIMEKIHQNLEYKSFDRPEGIVTAQVCRASGKLAVAGLCDCDPRGSKVATEYFERGTVPTEYCDTHVKVSIDVENNKVANEYCPQENLKEIVCIVKPDDMNYDDWTYDTEVFVPRETCDIHTGNNHSTEESTENEIGWGDILIDLPTIIDPTIENSTEHSDISENSSQGETESSTENSTEIETGGINIELPISIDDFFKPRNR